MIGLHRELSDDNGMRQNYYVHSVTTTIGKDDQKQHIMKYMEIYEIMKGMCVSLSVTSYGPVTICSSSFTLRFS